jgi:dTMP kinase
MMSLFITFEGGEGSGKSTQARLLYRKLHRLSIPVVLVHEPGSTLLGEKLARLLKRDNEISISPLTELLLFNAARAQLVSEVMLPSLEKGMVVVCDRYTDSTVAYQGYGRGLDIKEITALNEAATGGVKPDITFFVDLPVKVGLARKSETTDRFERETIAFHERVRKGYIALKQAEPQRFITIDGQQSKTAIAGHIWSKVSGMLQNSKDKR